MSELQGLTTRCLPMCLGTLRMYLQVSPTTIAYLYHPSTIFQFFVSPLVCCSNFTSVVHRGVLDIIIAIDAVQLYYQLLFLVVLCSCSAYILQTKRFCIYQSIRSISSYLSTSLSVLNFSLFSSFSFFLFFALILGCDCLSRQSEWIYR